jgi:hypothetical protein
VLEKFITRSIVLFRIEVLAAVEFDDDFAIEANEIDDVVAIRVLATEFAVVQLAVAQAAPEFGFGIGGRFAQASLEFRLENRSLVCP